jgi:lysophospholipase L1-like esterase
MRNTIQAAAFWGTVAASACSAVAGPPHWVWSSNTLKEDHPGEVVYFRKVIDVKNFKSASIAVTADNGYELFLNGKSIGADGDWATMETYDVTALLKPGKNVIAVKGINANDPGPAGVLLQLTLPDSIGEKTIETDATWKVSPSAPAKWNELEFDDSKWAAATDLGEVGKTGPWGTPARVGLPAPAAAPIPVPTKIDRDPFKLVDGDRVVLIGGTFLERSQQHGYIESALLGRYPDANIIYRNLAWSGDSVYGDARSYFDAPEVGFNRLVKNLQEFRPSVAVVCYGWSESWDGDKALPAFIAGMKRLIDVLDKGGASVVIVSPPPHERPPGGSLSDAASAHNTNLRLYGEALKKLATETNSTFLDAYQLLSAAEADAKSPLTYNTIHLSDAGYCAAAPLLLKGLGLAQPEWKLEIDAAKKTAAAEGATLADPKFATGSMSFTLTDAALPLPVPSDGPAGSGRVVRVAGLGDKKHTLKIDGKAVATATGKQWAAGVSIAAGPEFDQAEAMRDALVKKDANFFYRWRPANETYIFGFRKGEQGRNAVEMPQFDPIIADLEKKIGELKKPVAHKYEIAAGGDP